MSHRTEVFLHWIAAAWIVIVTLMAAFPESKPMGPDWLTPFKYLIGGTLGAAVVVFHLWMMVECIRGIRTRRRVPWLLFMFVFPLSSGVIYFLFTRSREFMQSSQAEL